MSTSRWLVTGLLALAASFGGGYLSAYLPAKRAAAAREAAAAATQSELARLNDELRETSFELHLAQLAVKMGAVYYDVNQNNYGMASEKLPDLLSGLSAVQSSVAQKPDLQSAILAILTRRDELVADLAKANPAVKAKIADMYSSLNQQLIR